MFFLRDIGFMDNPFDYAISEFMMKMHNSLLDKFFETITHLGDNGILFILVALVLLFNKQTRKSGIALAISLILCLIFNNLFIKIVVGRNRPFIDHLEFYDTVYNLLIPPTSGSFTSGHACASFAFATSIMLSYKDKKIYWISAYVLAFLIAFSRLYLLVHYFTDVLCGMILGIGLGFGGFYLFKLLQYIVALLATSNEQKSN